MPILSTDQDASPEAALDLLQKKKRRQASELCDRALASDPESDAWMHVKGKLLVDAGEFAMAEEMLNRAIARNRSNAQSHATLGNALHSQGKIDRAITSYRRALRLDPQLAEAHNDLGTAYFDKHWLKEAEASFRESVRLKPGHEAALSNLGATLRAMGRLKDAREIFQRVLRLRITRAVKWILPFWNGAAPKQNEPSEAPEADPEQSYARRAPDPVQGLPSASEIRNLIDSGSHDAAISAAQKLIGSNPLNAEAHHVLGRAFAAAGRTIAAIGAYERAISLDPNVASFHNNLGIAYQTQGLKDDAVQCYQRAVTLEPTFATAHNNLGAALRDQSQFELAVEACRTAVQLDPTLGQAYSSMAEALSMLGRYDEARESFERALKLIPGHIETWQGLGRMCLEQLDDLSHAEVCFVRALELNPNSDAAHHNLGLIAQLRGQFPEAHRRFRHAQRLTPNAVHANFSESLLFLLEGNFADGWSLYHWRLGLPSQSNSNMKLRTAVWDGSPIAGRSILIHGEQGLGDEIMFASCFPEIISAASRTVIACQPKLIRLFKSSFPTAEIVPMKPDWEKPWRENPAETDVLAAMGDLPRHLRPDRASFPKHAGYLHVDPKRTVFWAEKLRALGPGRRIGISWMGGTKKTWRSRRSVQLGQLKELFLIPNSHFISLQYGDTADQLADFSFSTGITVHHWPEAIPDYSETAALVTALDLVITVCTSIVHLSGSLGKPVWVMAPEVPEWRYGHDGPDMIWYPSARIYRQATRGDWAGVIQRITSDLDSLPQTLHNPAPQQATRSI